jgi:hypothetical protein
MGLRSIVVGSSLGRSTSPLPLPPHQFVVTGSLVRSGGNLDGYAVVLLGRFSGDSSLHVLEGQSSSDHDLAASDADGQFSLTVTTERKADSLAVTAFPLTRPGGQSAVAVPLP